MKTKIQIQRLQLSRETIRQLGDDKLVGYEVNTDTEIPRTLSVLVWCAK